MTEVLDIEVGGIVTLTFTVAVAGVPTNATVALSITLPDGTTSSPVATNPSTGSYTADYVTTQAGRHSYRWTATGAATAVKRGTFDVGNLYTTLAILKASLGITDTTDDLALSNAIAAASRAIDRITGTHFYTITEARTFQPEGPGSVWVDRFTSTTGLVVKTGTNGTYPTTVAAGDVVPWPLNAAKRGGAFCRLRIPTNVLPVYTTWPAVEVTAAWGWSTVPDEVEEACRLKAAALFKRKDSPSGVAGSGEFGVVRISRFEDPDVWKLLQPFMTPLVG